MSNDNLESDNRPQDAGTPTPPSAQPASNASGDIGKLLDRISKLEAKLDATYRNEQSEKDRSGYVKGELDKWKPVLEKVQAMTGMTPEQSAQVQREMEWDAMKARVFGQSEKPPAAQATDNTSAPMEKALQKYGLELNDPEVTAIIRENTDQTDRLLAIAELGARRKTATPPNPALNAAPAGGAPVAQKLTDAEVESKATELKNLYRNPTQNARRIAALEKELGW